VSKEVGEEERGRARMSGQEERQRHPSMLSCKLHACQKLQNYSVPPPVLMTGGFSKWIDFILATIFWVPYVSFQISNHYFPT
jgi:hypothetical protein